MVYKQTTHITQPKYKYVMCTVTPKTGKEGWEEIHYQSFNVIPQQGSRTLTTQFLPKYMPFDMTLDKVGTGAEILNVLLKEICTLLCAHSCIQDFDSFMSIIPPQPKLPKISK